MTNYIAIPGSILISHINNSNISLGDKNILALQLDPSGNYMIYKKTKSVAYQTVNGYSRRCELYPYLSKTEQKYTPQDIIESVCDKTNCLFKEQKRGKGCYIISKFLQM
jgi:hypothetical protein